MRSNSYERRILCSALSKLHLYICIEQSFRAYAIPAFDARNAQNEMHSLRMKAVEEVMLMLIVFKSASSHFEVSRIQFLKIWTLC